MGNDDLRGARDDCMRLLFRQPPAVLRPNACAPLDLRAARRVHGLRMQAKKSG